jgi:hypothetical protein
MAGYSWAHQLRERERKGKKGLTGVAAGSADGREQRRRRVGSKGGSCARLTARKKVRITGEKVVELITARSGGELRTARRKGD